MEKGKKQAVRDVRNALADAPAGKSLGDRRHRRALARMKARIGRGRAVALNGRGRLGLWAYEANGVLRVQAERLDLPFGGVQDRKALCIQLSRAQAAECGVTPADWATMTRKERATLRALARVREAQ